MSSMSRNDSTNPMKGFSVLQPSLGAPLSWMPEVGTKELEQLINAYLPGPASAQEKRATISMDFFEFAAQTGENFKYYPVQVNKTSQAARSPASSAAVSQSPAMSTMSYRSPSSLPSTPASRTASRTSAVKSEKTDYSHLPGMKILTTDGLDVTNSVSRGCKSKEQREHAHLMRVLKACDACKKKKIRCDPSHKRRSSSQVSTKAVTKPAKKAKQKAPSPSPSASQSTSAAFTPTPEASFELGMEISLDMDFDSFPSMDMDDILAFNPEPIDASSSQDFYGAVPQDFDFFLANEFSPAMASSTGSFDSPAQPLTPVSSGLFSQGDLTAFNDSNSLAFLQDGSQEPSLPYMTPGAHGSNYVDFNLYSPASSFIDEEPQKLRAGEKRKESVLQAEPTSPHSELIDANNAPATFNQTQSSTGLADEQQSRFYRSGATTFHPQESQWQVPGDQHFLEVIPDDELFGGVVFHKEQRPYQGDNDGHGRGRISTATTPHGSQQDQQATRRNSLVTALPGSLDPISSVSAPQSPRVIRQRVPQDESRVHDGTFAFSQTVRPSELHMNVSSLATPLAQSPISAHSLPTSVSPSTESSTLRGGLSPAGILPSNHRLSVNRGGVSVNSGLPVNRGLAVNHALPATTRTHGLIADSLHSAAVAAASAAAAAAHGPSPSTGITLAPRQAAAAAPVHSLVSQPGSTALFGLRPEGCTNGTINATTVVTTTSTDGLTLLSHGHQRQALHGTTITANAASSSLRRLLHTTVEVDVEPLSPVRQWLGHPSIHSELPTLLAVLGLVSMLLIMGSTSLLQQLQSPIFAHLLFSSSLALLSCLSALSPKQGALDKLKSIGRRQRGSGRRSGLSAMAGLAGLPLACF